MLIGIVCKESRVVHHKYNTHQVTRCSCAAARLVTGTRRIDHITPVLQSLHWLPVRQRVTFKLATLVQKCLNGRAPGYLADDFRPTVLPAAVVLGQPPTWWWTSLARRRHWETEHLPSQDRVSGTAFLLPESCWKPICLFKGRGASDLWTGALEMYWLTN